MKSKKHHQKIYEKRQKESGGVDSAIAKQVRLTKNLRGTKFQANKKISFVPGSSGGGAFSSISFNQQTTAVSFGSNLNPIGN